VIRNNLTFFSGLLYVKTGLNIRNFRLYVNVSLIICYPYHIASDREAPYLASLGYNPATGAIIVSMSVVLYPTPILIQPLGVIVKEISLIWGK
jgi:hypothetical protein